MAGFPTFDTARLQLRELTLDDAPFYLRHFLDPDIVDLTAFEAPKDLTPAKAQLLQYCINLCHEGRGIRWGIVLKATGELVGTCGYHAWDRRSRSCRIGYDLAREHRRKGIMTEALREMIRYGFEGMGLNRIEVHIDPRDVGSLALVSALGFVQEGVLRESTFFRGAYLDDVCLALLRREWARAGLQPSRPVNRRSGKREKRTPDPVRSPAHSGPGGTPRRPARPSR